MNDSNSQCLSAFDLDETLLKANCSFRFCLHLIRRRILSLSTLFHSIILYVRHASGVLSLRQLHEHVFQRYLVGFPLSLLQEEVALFVSRLCPKDFYAPALAHFKRAQELGHHTVLISSSPEFLVAPIGAALGFNETFASIYEVDHDGRLCQIFSVLDGAEKGALLKQIVEKQGLKTSHVIAYSDSHLDLEFLSQAGIPVAVNPNRKLKKEAYKHQWLIV